MNNENPQMIPSAQEPQDTQSQQPTPDTIQEDTQQAAQPITPQTAPEANPQNTNSLIPAPPAGLKPASSAKDKGLIVLTASGLKSLAMCIDEAYNSPVNSRYVWTPIGISNLFADIFSRIVRYATDRNMWFVFNGKCWTEDRGEVMEFCKSFTEEVQEYSKDTLHLMPKKQQRYIQNLADRIPRETILKDASSIESIRIEMSAFDTDPMLFNCQNGTFDLRTGILREHNPDDMITKMSNVIYDPQARCARWEQHIDEVMEGDTAKAEFLQKAFGLCLTGENPYECFFILYGPTSRNGKGTTMETFMAMVGDYGKAIRPVTVEKTQKSNGSGATEDIARLDKARVVNISDPEQKLVLNNSLIKAFTGRDTITARYLYQNSFEFKPGFKAVMNTNHLPVITDPTMFTSGRVRVIPFMHHFDDTHQDKTLKDTLIQPQNLSGIFNWSYKGWKLLQAQGFDPPASVIEATAEYQQDSDNVAQFVAERMTRTPGTNTRTQAVYEDYVDWCNANGCSPENQSKFKKALGAHAKIGRSHSAGSEKLKHATFCVLDYSLRTKVNVDVNLLAPQPSDDDGLQSQGGSDDYLVPPLTAEEIDDACAEYGFVCIPDPSINNYVDISMYDSYAIESPIGDCDS